MKKRVLSWLLVLVLVLGMLPGIALAADETPVGTMADTLSGSGTAADPYLIEDAGDLQSLGGQELTGEYQLAADLDMSGREVTPIKKLTGTFDGNGFTIKNLSLTGGNGSYNWSSGAVYVNTGLIGELNGVVKNTVLENVAIDGIGRYNNVGALVGYIPEGSSSTVQNCMVSGEITSTATSGFTLLGGLVGFVYGTGDQPATAVISDCVSDITLQSARGSYVGGLVGSMQGNSEVEVTNCAVLGDFSSTSTATAGGLVGYMTGGPALKISRAYLGGAVYGNTKAGIAYAMKSSTASVSADAFYYDSEKNPDSASYLGGDFELFLKGSSGSVGTVTGWSKEQAEKTTAELQALTLDGFAQDAALGYPVPAWVCALGTADRALQVTAEGAATITLSKDGKTIELAAGENDTFTASGLAAGVYTYTATAASGSGKGGCTGTLVVGKLSQAQRTLTLPEQTFSCTLTITAPAADVEVVLYHGTDASGTPVSGTKAGQVYSYTLTETGDYFYTYTESYGGKAGSGSFTLTDADTEKSIGIVPEEAERYTVAFTSDTEGFQVAVQHDGEAVSPVGTEFQLFAGEYTYTATAPGCKTITGSLAVSEAATQNLSFTAAVGSGSGTQEDPYRITSAEELRSFAEQVNAGYEPYAAAYVELGADIDTTSESWTPLGKNAVFPFKGCFDGKGHSVTITVDDPSLSYFGFFGCLVDAAVSNLTVEGEVYCSEPYAFVGGLAGRARGNVAVSGCINNATISTLARGSAGVGGLIGGYDDNVDYRWEDIRLELSGCTNNGLILVTGSDSSAFVGGIVGANANCVQLRSCTNNGTVYAPGVWVGGLLGQAGYQTGDYYPAITDCSNTAVLIGAPEKTNQLYGKGTIAANRITGSGDNVYSGGNEITDVLLLEAQKYCDVVAVSSTASVGDTLVLLQGNASAGEGFTLTCSQGPRDIASGYVSCENGEIFLRKLNQNTKVITETATLWLEKDEMSLSKPITIHVYPSATAEGETLTARQALMHKIAATYANSSADWVNFDMAAYASLGFGENKANKTNYLNLTVNQLATDSPLATDRAKAEIILAALDVDSTKLTPYDSAVSFSNAEKLQQMNLGTSYYTAPWVLLAEEAGKLTLTDAQRSAMIGLLTRNQSDNGLFRSIWGTEKYDDVDTTGTALAALARFYSADEAVQAFVDKALRGLSLAQGSNGSYGNVNSDAMVVTGLAALGIDPGTDPRFVKNGCSLADALLLYVNGSGDGFSTGYISGAQGDKATALATEQGFRALITLEAMGTLPSGVKAFNIYTVKPTAGAPDPDKGYVADGNGVVTLPSDGDTKPPVGGDTQKNVAVRLQVQAGQDEQLLEKSVMMPANTTAKQLVEKVLTEADISFRFDKGDTYLQSITYNGVTLSELGQGENSGWMYKVNGTAPQVGMDSYLLQEGDQVKLYYTSDWTKEQGTGTWTPGTGEQTADQKAAAAVEKLIKAIGTVTKDSGKQITAAREAYEALTETQKQLVSNYATLTAAEKAYAKLTGSLPFTDVEEHWALGAIAYSYTHDLMNGISADKFYPESSLNRAMLATILYRLAGEPDSKAENVYSDVADAAWYTEAVLWASEAGVVTGYGDGTFGPEDNITREQMAAMLYRYAAYQKYDVTAASGLQGFSDAGSISDWALEALEWAHAEQLINGRSTTTIVPGGSATRAEAATILMRFCEHVAE